MVTDDMGCIAYDTIVISSPQAPEGLVSGGDMPVRMERK